MSRAHDKDSKCAELLRALSITQEEIGAAVGKSHVTAGHWIRGRSRPDPKARRTLFALYAIPVASWDEPLTTASAETAAPTSKKAPPKKARPSKPPASALGKAAKLSRLCDQMFDDIEVSKNIRERASVAKSLASVISQLAKVTSEYGGAARLSEAPLVKRLIQAVKDGCRDHKEAWADIEAELRRVDAEVRGVSPEPEDDQ